LEARVDKCYSEENYAKFQEDVVKIVISTLGSDEGRKKIKEHAKESAGEYAREHGWSRLTF
jgi:hypothetical protein